MEVNNFKEDRSRRLRGVTLSIFSVILFSFILGVSITAEAQVRDSALLGNYPTFKEQVKRGDFEFRKIHGVNMSRLANIPFLVTSKTTGEQHVIVSDANGEVKTSAAKNPHTQNTNQNDEAINSSSGSTSTIDEEKLDSSAGIWFGQVGEDIVGPDDALGALPYDTYTVQELSVSSNRGLDKVSFDIEINRENYVVDVGTVADMPIEITTSITNVAAFDRYVEEMSTVTLVDKVSYSGLKPGQVYTISGTLRYAQKNNEGEVFDAGPVEFEDGSEVVSRQEFKPTRSSGTTDVPFEFNLSELGDRSIVAYEECYLGDELIAEHKDITFEGQTVTLRPTEDPPATPAETTQSQGGLPKTGDADLLGIIVFVMCSCSLLCLCSLSILKKNRSNERLGR